MNLPEAVALILKALEEHETRAVAPKFIDVDKSELVSGNAARQAWRRGELRLFRIGKRLLVDAEELHGWIRQHEEHPPKSGTTTEPELDEVDQALAGGGVVVARRRAG